MPATILTWKEPARRPRKAGGEILRMCDGGDDGRCTHRHSSDDAETNEQPPFAHKGATQCGHDEKNGDNLQHFLTAESSGRRSGQNGAQDRADQTGRHGKTLRELAQLPQMFEYLFRAGNDHCLKPEQESAQGGDQRDTNGIGKHSRQFID